MYLGFSSMNTADDPAPHLLAKILEDAGFESLWYGEHSHIPGAYWVVLGMIAVLAFAAMGYHGGVAGTTRSPVMAAVAVTFSLVIALIVDIDRPGEGWINVQQDAMFEVRGLMQRTSD